MPSNSKSIGLQEKRSMTLERISLLILLSLMYLVGSTPNNLPLTKARPAKKTRTTNDIFGDIEYKDKVATITSLQ